MDDLESKDLKRVHGWVKNIHNRIMQWHTVVDKYRWAAGSVASILYLNDTS